MRKYFFTGQDLKSVGMSTFTEILNVVAPPIAEHEVIEIWLSHDMRGYDGVESLVYECMAKVRSFYGVQPVFRSSSIFPDP